MTSGGTLRASKQPGFSRTGVLHVQASLFESSAPFMAWLPDETFFSLCSRHHRLWGYATSGQSAELLFGRRQAGTQHDFPNSLGEFERRTSGCLGTAGTLASTRTLLRYYRPFLAPNEVTHAVERMRGRSVAYLKASMGLLASGFRANHPLKACPTCMQVDFEKEGWTYWHLQHQFPGVWICPWHTDPLFVSTIKSTGVSRFGWHLPSREQLVRGWRALRPGSEEALRRIAHLSISLVERNADDGWLRLERLQSLLVAQAARRGWITAAGSLRLKQAAPDYLSHCARFREVAEFDALAHTLAQAQTHIGRLLRYQTDTHPLRLVLAIDWLFDNVEDFIAADENRSTDDCGADNASMSGHSITTARAASRERFVELLHSGHTATSAARHLGIAVSTAIPWAVAEGVRIKRRPKTVADEIWAKLVKDLRRGTDKADTAARHGVSIATVIRVLRSEVGLHAIWKTARAAKSRAAARKTWMSLLATHPGLGSKFLRAIKPAAYAWLYRNDRVWLTEHAPRGLARSPSPRKNTVRRDGLDETLSLAVRQAVLLLAQDLSPKMPRLWQIYQAVPELRPKLKVLHRLPLTKRALDDALTRRRSPREKNQDLFK